MDTYGSNEELGERLEALRHSAGWTYRELSAETERVGNRIAPSALQRIEKGAAPGKPRPKVAVDDLLTLCRVYGRTPNDMLTPLALVDQEHAQQVLAAIRQSRDELWRAADRLYLALGEVESVGSDGDRAEQLTEYLWNRIYAMPPVPSVNPRLIWIMGEAIHQVVKVARAQHERPAERADQLAEAQEFVTQAMRHRDEVLAELGDAADELVKNLLNQQVVQAQVLLEVRATEERDESAHEAEHPAPTWASETRRPSGPLTEEL